VLTYLLDAVHDEDLRPQKLKVQGLRESRNLEYDRSCLFVKGVINVAWSWWSFFLLVHWRRLSGLKASNSSRVVASHATYDIA